MSRQRNGNATTIQNSLTNVLYAYLCPFVSFQRNHACHLCLWNVEKKEKSYRRNGDLHPAKMTGRTTLRRATFSQYFVMPWAAWTAFHPETKKWEMNDCSLESIEIFGSCNSCCKLLLRSIKDCRSRIPLTSFRQKTQCADVPHYALRFYGHVDPFRILFRKPVFIAEFLHVLHA